MMLSGLQFGDRSIRGLWMLLCSRFTGQGSGGDQSSCPMGPGYWLWGRQLHPQAAAKPSQTFTCDGIVIDLSRPLSEPSVPEDPFPVTGENHYHSRDIRELPWAKGGLTSSWCSTVPSHGCGGMGNGEKVFRKCFGGSQARRFDLDFRLTSSTRSLGCSGFCGTLL